MNLSKLSRISFIFKHQQYMNRFPKAFLYQNLTLCCKFSFGLSLKDQIKQAEIDYAYKKHGANQWYLSQIEDFIYSVKGSGEAKQIFRICQKNNERILREFGEQSQKYYYHLMLPLLHQAYPPSEKQPLLIYQRVEELLRKYPNHKAYSWSVYMRNVEFYVGSRLVAMGHIKQGYDKLKQYLNNPKRLLLHSDEMLQMELAAQVIIFQKADQIEDFVNKDQLSSQIESVISQIEKQNYLKKDQINVTSVICFYIERANHLLIKRNREGASSCLKKMTQVIAQAQTLPIGFQWPTVFFISHLFPFLKLQREQIILLETVLAFVHRREISHPTFQGFNSELESLYIKQSNKEGILRCKARADFFCKGIKDHISQMNPTIKQSRNYFEFLRQLKDYDERLISKGASLTDEEVNSYQVLLRKFYLRLEEENGRGLTSENISFLRNHFFGMKTVGFKLRSLEDIKHLSRQKRELVDAFFQIQQIVSKKN